MAASVNCDEKITRARARGDRRPASQIIREAFRVAAACSSCAPPALRASTLQALRVQVAAPAPRPAPRKAAAKAAPKRKIAPPRDALATFRARVRAAVAKGERRVAAVARITREDPALHRAVLAQANPGRRVAHVLAVRPAPTATETFRAKVQKAKASGLSALEATQKVIRENPELYERVRAQASR